MELPDSIPALWLEHPLTVNIAPVTSPAKAAAATIDPVLFFMLFSFLFCLLSNRPAVVKHYFGQTVFSEAVGDIITFRFEM